MNRFATASLAAASLLLGATSALAGGATFTINSTRTDDMVQIYKEMVSVRQHCEAELPQKSLLLFLQSHPTVEQIERVRSCIRQGYAQAGLQVTIVRHIP